MRRLTRRPEAAPESRATLARRRLTRMTRAEAPAPVSRDDEQVRPDSPVTWGELFGKTRRVIPIMNVNSYENVESVDQEYDPLMDGFKRARNMFREARKDGYLHISDLLHRCMKAKVLQARYGMEPPPQQLTLSDQFTYAQGDAIHDLAKAIQVREQPNKVWGKWKCRCGTLRHDEPCLFAEVEPETCPHCGTEVNEYVEVSMHNDELKVVGNPDLLLYEADLDAFHINELKSMSAEMYKELVRPVPEHVLQVVAYWQLMHWLGYRLTNRVTICYITKGWQFGSTLPMKSFTLFVEPELPRLNDLWNAAEQYRASEAGETAELPPGLCSTSRDKHAKDCNVCRICFG